MGLIKLRLTRTQVVEFEDELDGCTPEAVLAENLRNAKDIPEHVFDDAEETLTGEVVVTTNATTGAQTCVHCDPSFVPTGPDGWCDCSCHKPAATTSAATPSGLGSMRRERYIWDSAISTAVAEVERLVDGWKNEGRFTLCWATRKDTASEIITALRALQPSS